MNAKWRDGVCISKGFISKTIQRISMKLVLGWYTENHNPTQTLKMSVFWDVASCCLVYKFTDVSEVLAASIIRAVNARTSETLVNFYQTT
jgi:hypothetical protein